ncbi:MAG: tryptophan synthase subunit alpha, partial [Alphaproteobacteria bacterium]|nr:tryptophan synthase subunit alpha [Alphaproteobacteria bacterium]
LALIRLVGPETGAAALAEIVSGARGFLYYRTVAGVTGGVAPGLDAIATGVARVRALTHLPIAVGFGIRTPAEAGAVAAYADAVVVGSALVETIADHVAADGRATDALIPAARSFVAELARAAREARHGKAGVA